MLHAQSLIVSEALGADRAWQRHWPVPMAVHRFERVAEGNSVLAGAFGAMRAADPAVDLKAFVR